MKTKPATTPGRTLAPNELAQASGGLIVVILPVGLLVAIATTVYDALGGK